jgi:ankyrin repeat protein
MSPGTALQHAIRQRNPALVALLLKHGANPDVTGEPGNPLQECIEFGDSRVLSLLLEHGANVNQKDGKGVTPLYIAARANDRYALERLIEHGAETNIAEDEHGWTPYLCAVAQKSQDVGQSLLKLDASLPSLGELLALPPSKFCMRRGSGIVMSAQNPGTKFSMRM